MELLAVAGARSAGYCLLRIRSGPARPRCSSAEGLSDGAARDDRAEVGRRGVPARGGMGRDRVNVAQRALHAVFLTYSAASRRSHEQVHRLTAEAANIRLVASIAYAQLSSQGGAAHDPVGGFLESPLEKQFGRI